MLILCYAVWLFMSGFNFKAEKHPAKQVFINGLQVLKNKAVHILTTQDRNIKKIFWITIYNFY